ncbi:hypothetical protein JCM9492_13590 [Aquifex pyrophilus]
MEGRNPKDLRLFRKEESIDKYLLEARAKGYSVLIYPNPIKVPKKAWGEYTKARKRGESTLAVAKKYKLLVEDNIAELRTVVLDLDTEYERVRKLWDEFIKTFGIEGYVLERSKSGRFKAYLFLKPYLTERGIAWYKPRAKHNNGHTHLENLRELYGIWIGWWQRKEINADTSFFYNLNHAVWYPEVAVEGKVSKIEEIKEEYAGSLYNLYRRAKEVQAEQGIWSFNSKGKWINLTAYFWGDKLPYVPEEYKRMKEEARKLKVPSFLWKVAKKVDGQVKEKEKEVEIKKEDIIERLYTKAVKSLASRHRSHRFIHVFFPAVGWAKNLGLDEDFVYEVLREAVPDKRNFDKDFKKAWKYARELEFNLPKWVKGKESIKKEVKGKRNLGKFLKELERTEITYWIERAKSYLRKKKEATRQELIHEVFKKQRWLCDEVIKLLERSGEVEVSVERRGVGRPRKVVRWKGREEGEFRRPNNNGCLISSQPPSASGGKGTSLEVVWGIKQGTLEFGIDGVVRLAVRLKEVLRRIPFGEPIKLRELRERIRNKEIYVRRIELVLKALEEEGLIEKRRRGRKGIEVRLKDTEVYDEYLVKLLNGAILYKQLMDEREKFFEKRMEWKERKEELEEKRKEERRKRISSSEFIQDMDIDF